MAFINPTINTGRFGTGSLLRKAGSNRQEMIEEAKPSAQPSSPFRELLRTTLLSTVTPGTERVTPLRAEAEAPPPSQVVQPSVGTPNVSMPVVSPVADRPQFQPSGQPSGQAPGQAPSSPQQTAAPAGPSTGSVLGSQTSKPTALATGVNAASAGNRLPGRSGVGANVGEQFPLPTGIPSQPGMYSPGPNNRVPTSLDKMIQDLFRNNYPKKFLTPSHTA